MLSAEINLLEGLAATGLRSVRFALEIPHWLPQSPSIKLRVIANDVDPVAADLARVNVTRNNVTDVMSVECDDVVMLMLGKVRDAKKDENDWRRVERKRKYGDGGGEAAATAAAATDRTRSSDSEGEEECATAPGGVVDFSDRVFQVIDLDPYGTAAPFLDSAVQVYSKDYKNIQVFLHWVDVG